MASTGTAGVAILFLSGLIATAGADILGTAQNFAVLAGSTATNTGPTTLTGDLGVWPGTAATGFPPGAVVGTVHLGDGVAQQAQADVTVAYNALAAMALNANLSGTNLGGLTLLPGVYRFDSSAFLNGTLTLDAMGDADAMFVFQIGSTLISATGAAVLLINGADGCNTYWQVGSSATLGTGTAFQGNILAEASITLATGATITDGRALARNGAVTMDSNTITAGCIPTPGAATLFGAGVVGVVCFRRRAVAA